MKVLMLVISSNTFPVYIEHRKVWQRYMRSNPNIDCYFIQYNPSLRFVSHTFDGETLTFPGIERFETIYSKTIASLRYFLSRKSYDYVVRTNLSSVWDFTKLLTYLETRPRTGFYSGGAIDTGTIFSFATGAGILWSEDVARLLASNPGPYEKWTPVNDDIVIGYCLQQLGVGTTPGCPKRIDFHKLEHFEREKYTIPDDAFHFRFKHVDSINSRLEEPITMNRFLDQCIFAKPLKLTKLNAEDTREQGETKQEEENNN